MLVDMIAVHSVLVAIMQVIHVIPVLYGFVSASGTMLVIVASVHIAFTTGSTLVGFALARALVAFFTAVARVFFVVLALGAALVIFVMLAICRTLVCVRRCSCSGVGFAGTSAQG
jgi:hypothetical protein